MAWQASILMQIRETELAFTVFAFALLAGGGLAGGHLRDKPSRLLQPFAATATRRRTGLL